MGKMSRNKGAAGEREFITLVCELTGIDRSLVTRNQAQTFEGGHDVLGMEPFAVEVKRYKTATIPQRQLWWKQAVDQTLGTMLIPALAYRADFQPEWRVIVPGCVMSPSLRNGRSHRGKYEWDQLFDLHTVVFSRMLSLVLERELLK